MVGGHLGVAQPEVELICGGMDAHSACGIWAWPNQNLS